MKAKNDTFSVFKKFKSLIKNLKDPIIKTLHTNWRGTYVSKEFTQFCEQSEISWQLINVDIFHKNGIAKHKNNITHDKVKNLSLNNNVPSYLWTKVFNIHEHQSK